MDKTAQQKLSFVVFTKYLHGDDVKNKNTGGTRVEYKPHNSLSEILGISVIKTP
jgi:hypothetical protein